MIPRAANEHVARLHVTTQDAGLVRVSERRGHLADNLQRDRSGERAVVIQQMEEVTTVDQLCCNEEYRVARPNRRPG